MIHSARIKNFQSHRDSYLEFHPGVNIIIGESDSGKSAIFRALKLAAKNEPTGDSYCSTWGGVTDVNLINDKSENVSRIRSKSENYYQVNDLKLKAFGVTPPKEVLDVLNLTDINFQNQLDSPFLLMDTSGEVATHFNKVANLDLIDKSRQNINKWLNDLNSSKKAKEIELQKNKDKLTQYDDLDKIEIEIEVLEGMETKRNSASSKLSILKDILNQIREIERDKLNAELITGIEIMLVPTLVLFSEKRDLEQTAVLLQSLLKEIKDIENDMNFHTELLEIKEPLERLMTLKAEKDVFDVEFTTLDTLVEDIINIYTKIAGCSNKVDVLEKEFEELFPDVCPLCNTDLSKCDHGEN